MGLSILKLESVIIALCEVLDTIISNYSWLSYYGYTIYIQDFGFCHCLVIKTFLGDGGYFVLR